MMRPQVHQYYSSVHSTQTLLPLQKPIFNIQGKSLHKPSNSTRTSNNLLLSSYSKSIRRPKTFRIDCVNLGRKAVVSSPNEKAVKIKAEVTVKITVSGFLSSIGLDRGLDDIQDVLGKTLLLELLSSELDPSKYSNYYRKTTKIIFF